VYDLAALHRARYIEVALKVESLSGYNIFSIIQHVTRCNEVDAYVMLVYSEYKIELGRSIALILNEMIKEQLINELELLAIQSRYRKADDAYKRYGTLHTLFQENPVLLALWQVKS